jgi:gas vesicle protein
MSSNEDSTYTKGFILGALIGGAAGAITALLLAPKSGAELRHDIVEKFDDVKENLGENVTKIMNEGKIKADGIISSAKRQAQEILSNAETIFVEAKSKAANTKDSLQDKFDTLKEATKAGVDAFKDEMKTGEQQL